MDKLEIKEEIKVLQAELNNLIKNVDKDTLLSTDITKISEQLDILIVELHKLVR